MVGDARVVKEVRRFRLRYQSTNLEMTLGEFAIGRSSSCNLALADGLVSRRHAIMHVGPEHVVVEDLGSRNGVAVNGVRINGPRRLAHMDRIYIGSQELVLIDAAKLGVFLLFGMTFAVQGAFASFFIYLWRRARKHRGTESRN